MGEIGGETETTMEKLELLSRTAVLKQGMDGTDSSGSASASGRNNSTSSHCEKVVLLDNNNRLMMGIPIFPQTQHLLSAAAAATAVAVPPIASSGDRRSRTTSPSTFSINTSTVVGCNLASPVSTDGEDEDDVGEVTTTASIASGKSRHNLHSTKSRIIESRSPITTVEHGQTIAVPPSSPFPSSPPPSYGSGFLPYNLNQLLQQEQQDYPPSLYHNHSGNITRTLSEASFAPIYGSNSIPNTSHTTTTAAINNCESDTAFHPPQQQQTPSRRRYFQQRRQSSPSHEDMARQIRDLRDQLSVKDMLVSSLQHRVSNLENQNDELRQLPTGKISHIPVE